MDSTSQTLDLGLEEETGVDAGFENDEETQRLIVESHQKTLPVNIAWMVSTSCGMFAILWALVAALSNRKSINAKELPYLGFLFANLLVLLIVEIPDVVIFTTGQQVHNDWTKFVYDAVNNIPLFNFAWIGLQSWIQNLRPDFMSVKKSFGIGAMLWLLGISFALPLSVSFSLIDEDHEYMTKFIPLFLVSFLLQKGLPLIFSFITIFLANMAITSRVEDYCANKERKCCWTLFEKSTRSHVLNLIAIVIYTLVWVSEDIHILIYLFNGGNLAGLELFHIAIYNLIETTGIFVVVCLIICGNENLRCIRVCNDSAQVSVEPYNKSVNASITSLLTKSPEDPESGEQ